MKMGKSKISYELAIASFGSLVYICIIAGCYIDRYLNHGNTTYYSWFIIVYGISKLVRSFKGIQKDDEKRESEDR